MFEEGIILKEKYGAENVYDFSIGNPDLDPPEKFFTTVLKIINERVPGTHGYMPNAGYTDVREIIAQKTSSEQGVTLHAEHIVMTCGAAGALNVIFKTLFDPGDEVIVPAPYFVEYGSYADNHQGKVVPVATAQNFALDTSAVKNAVTPRTKAVLINSPNNPTGRVYTKAELESLACVLNDMYHASGQTIYLIADEPYREIVYDGVEVPGILATYKNSLVATSYSKSLSIPGERIGFIAVNPLCENAAELVAGLTIANRSLGFVNAPALMQHAVAELTAEKVQVEKYKKRRDMLAACLREAGLEFEMPQGAFYFFCKSPLADDIEFVDHLKKYNILAVPGSGFAGPGFIRLCYCVPEDVITRSIPKFKQAMQELKK